MIPDKAYELARSAGWIEPRDARDLPMRWEITALDPKFFQCLGKALGWSDVRKMSRIVSVHSASTFHLSDTRDNWKEETYLVYPCLELAHRFYDLILTGGDLEKFWEELLPAQTQKEDQKP